MQTISQRLPTSSNSQAFLDKGFTAITLPRPSSKNSLMTVMVGGQKRLEHSTGSALLDSLLNEKDLLTRALHLEQTSISIHPYFDQTQKEGAIAASSAKRASLKKAYFSESDPVLAEPIAKSVSKSELVQNNLTLKAAISSKTNVANQQQLRKLTEVAIAQDSLAVVKQKKEPVQRGGLQLSKFDVGHGLVEVEDSLLFGGTKNFQGSINIEDNTVVFDYLTRQVSSFTLPKSAPPKFPRTTYLKPTDAGVHVIQDKVVLRLEDLAIEEKVTLSDSQQSAITSSSQEASKKNRGLDAPTQLDTEKSIKHNTSIIGCLSKRLDLLTEAVDSLNQEITKLQAKNTAKSRATL